MVGEKLLNLNQVGILVESPDPANTLTRGHEPVARPNVTQPGERRIEIIFCVTGERGSQR